MTLAASLAIDAAFTDDNISMDALYRVGGAGDGVAVRVIFRKPDEVINPFSTGAVSTAYAADVRVSDVASPKENDTVEIDSVIYRVAAYVADKRRLRHTLKMDLA